jgi:tRNA A-37 threonylcarbamoyl transferase component Bud32
MNRPSDIHTKAFGRFELLNKLGRGATATVYKARDRSNGQIVAIKIGSRQLALETRDLARFKREFTAVSHLRHPHLVAALDLGEEHQVPYLVLEFVDGVTLEKRLEDGPMTVQEALPVIAQVADGLRFLHQNQILHRDIKPGNIFLDTIGQAKVGDFGLLKLLATGQSAFTRSGQGMGTIAYGPPEQFEDARNTDFSCDIYSLAGTFYTALTGFYPFGVASPMRVLQRKLHNKFVPLQQLVPAAPAALDRLIARSLDASRANRPATADEFLKALMKVTAQVAAAATTAVPAARAAGGGGPERRTAPRVSVKTRAGFMPFHEVKRSPWNATIRDASTGGLCLQADTDCAVDTLLEVSVVGKPVSFLAQVRWVKPAGAHYILGCAFVRPPDPKDIDDLIAGGAGK